MLGHVVIGETSLFRRMMLYIFARYIEVPLLRISYHFLRGKWKKIGDIKLFRRLMGFFLAKPFGYLGDTARPVPYAYILQYIDEIDGPIAVGPCRCRMGHKACDHPMETDIVLRTGYNAWMRAFPKQYRTISKEEAKKIITQTHHLNMFHMVFIHCPINLYNEYVVCNCCTCGCVPYIINRELTQINFPLIDGYFMAITNRNRCKGCEQCVKICPFDARSILNGRSRTSSNCFGCGLCYYVCPEQAISLKQLKSAVLERDDKGDPPPEYKPGFYKQHPPLKEE